MYLYTLWYVFVSRFRLPIKTVVVFTSDALRAA